MNSLFNKLDVLVIDDHPENIRVLSQLLEKNDYKVRKAINGKSGLRAARSSPPDLILLDVIMPEMNGYEVCENLKADKSTQDIPVIFISALDEMFDKVKAFSCGGIDYISKPFQAEEVLARMKIHLTLHKTQKRLYEQNMQLEKEINQHKQTEKLLQQAKEMAEMANGAKSSFLANMSHEIRTPMNAIFGFTEILENLIADEKQREYLSIIRSSSSSLLHLINDILDLAKVEANKLKLEYAIADVHSAFNKMKQIFYQKIADKKLSFEIEIAPTLPKMLVLDEKRLHQILFNLIGNAIKFTNKGHIKLSAHDEYPQSEMTQEKAPDKLNLIFSVADTGIGIPKDQHQTIFKAFEQSHTKFEGTGLGLAITKQLVKLMGGNIHVHSEEKKGSCFYVALNNVEIASFSKAPEAMDFDIDTVSFAKATILIVDDMEVNRKLLKCYLNLYDFTLLEAENGAQAIEIIKLHKPDLVFMDIRMPVLDGYKAIQAIKNDRQLKHIPVVAVTASSMKEEREKVSALCDAFLSKPISKSVLIKELMKFLEHNTKVKDTSSPAEDTKTSVVDCLPGALEKLPALIEELECLQPQYQRLCSECNINNIEDFAKDIQKLGNKYKYLPMVEWAKTLEKWSNLFDVEKLMQTLKEFPRVVAKIKKLF